ncbi:MAG: type II toxin-antitoxin system VapC family toxin [Verrucomicrobiaceae bacterium]|nr:type II toxin-antitoxin system VapC family toxin [Verrucomicrobiaceae bacterium]
MVFPDTSFLCSVYRTQEHSPKADTFMAKRSGPIPVSSLLLLEFRQSLRLQVRLHTKDKTKGFTKSEATQMLRDLQSDLRTKVLEVMPVDWSAVHYTAEELSERYTETKGHRLADILHVATALHLGADEFLTFDANQKALAEAEGLVVKV